jgi:hypothetical protein
MRVAARKKSTGSQVIEIEREIARENATHTEEERYNMAVPSHGH